MRGESAHDTPKALGEMANVEPLIIRLKNLIAEDLLDLGEGCEVIEEGSSLEDICGQPFLFSASSSRVCSIRSVDSKLCKSGAQNSPRVSFSVQMLSNLSRSRSSCFGFPVAVVIVNDEPFLKLLRNLKALSGKKRGPSLLGLLFVLRGLHQRVDLPACTIFGYGCEKTRCFREPVTSIGKIVCHTLSLDMTLALESLVSLDSLPRSIWRRWRSQPLLSQQPQRSIHCAEQQQVLEPVLVPEAASLLVVEGGSRREICSRAPWQRTFPRAAPRLSNRMEVQEKVLMRVTLMRTSLTRRRRSSQRTCYLRGNGIVELMTRVDDAKQ
ncbi:hypothetical protein KCU93_g484, partial [Aureobasidium melanogenum]